jgi:hypothetical protein
MEFSFVNVIADWEAYGVFDYVLPFLIIFAVVFGILTSTNVFSGNKGVNLTVALAVALISLRFDYVPVFFSEIFPKFGIGLAVLIVLMIMTALFVPNEWMKGWAGTMWAVGAVVAITVIYKSFDFLGWNIDNSGWWDQYGSVTVLGILLVLAIAAIAMPKIEFGPPTPATYGKHRQDE